MPGKKRVWAYDPDPATGRNVGTLCKVCSKVYRARFRGKYTCVASLKESFGKDGNLYQLWKYFWDLAIEVMKTALSYEARVAWGTEDQAKSLIVNRGRETRLEDPDDEVWSLSDYTKARADSLILFRSGHTATRFNVQNFWCPRWQPLRMWLADLQGLCEFFGWLSGCQRAMLIVNRSSLHTLRNLETTGATGSDILTLIGEKVWLAFWFRGERFGKSKERE